MPASTHDIQIGVDSFAAAFDENSRAISSADRVNDLVSQIERADQVGLDVFGVGEHHRREFLDSAPAVILGAAAARTTRIRLTSAVTVLSAADPVRVFQNFATLDLLSRGRAEMIVGRGSSIEAFPLFGFHLDHYDELFEEKLDLLLKVRANEHVHWSGRFRAPLTGQGVYPRPLQNPLPIWVGVYEANAIAVEIEKVTTARPMTHDLIKNILEGINASVTRVVVNDLRDSTFYATISLSLQGKEFHIDSRPSDDIAVALRVRAPIYVTLDVIERAGSVDVGAQSVSEDPERLKEWLDNLKPEDFGKL